jgi:hypothetical protein
MPILTHSLAEEDTGALDFTFETSFCATPLIENGERMLSSVEPTFMSSQSVLGVEAQEVVPIQTGSESTRNSLLLFLLLLFLVCQSSFL